MKSAKKTLIIISAIIAAFVLIAIFGMGSDVKGIREMRYGIDIRGGVEAIFEPQDLDRKATQSELDSAREVIESRLDAQNITDREVTIDGDAGYIIVRFPWKSSESSFNPEDAIAELGDMAKLTFRDPSGNVLLDGKHVKTSNVQRDTTSTKGQYVVALTFDSEGSTAFEKLTGENIGKNIGIYMDEDRISNPVVENKISGGQAEINGMSGYDEAKVLSDKINSGALPFSLATSSYSTISPTLGNNALNVMLIAGLIAFILVCIFMIYLYKLPGIIACITLFLQITIQLLAISVPQYTLTLPGIAGIILSVGMSVDANIIISERISEEMKKGYIVKTSIINGYKNAFSSVLDGNVTTAAVAIILMIFGSGTMLSFGYTLLVGMFLNLIAGVTISKKLNLSMIAYKRWNNEKWYRQKKDLKIFPFFKKKFVYLAISLGVFALGIVMCFVNGIKLDTQFTGGAVLSYSVNQEVETANIQSAVEKVTNRTVTAQVTKSNTNDSISLELTLAGNGGLTPDEQKEITQAVKDACPGMNVQLSQTYAVQPYIGAKALKNAGIAILLSFIFIIVYVAIRFSVLSGISAGITSIIALLHDTVVVFFAFIIFGIPLNDAFVAVILTIIGYSINDTIVVYDRIRENRKKNVTKDDVELNDLSVSQVFTRSVNSSITTAICVLTMVIASLIFNIQSILQFSLPMFFGLISGCYSSICIASVLWTLWNRRKEKPGDKNTNTYKKDKKAYT
jgi:SecD/SecF fusion protein